MPSSGQHTHQINFHLRSILWRALKKGTKMAAARQRAIVRTIRLCPSTKQ